MKIDGMEASTTYGNVPVAPVSQATVHPKSEELTTKDKTKDIPKNQEDLSTILDGKSISQINNADKNVMTASEKAIIDAVEKANKVALGRNTSFRFSIHEGTKKIMVKVLDSDTNETIREIPSEKVLDMVAKMWEMSGLFVDEKR